MFKFCLVSVEEILFIALYKVSTFSKCSFVWNEPLEVPDNIHENQIKYYQKLLEEKIDQSIKKAKNNCQW